MVDKNVNSKRHTNYAKRSKYSRRNLWGGFLFGLGFVEIYR